VCRELEEEVERVRAFYTKKVEEVQRKGEAQLRALKRGTEAATTAPGTCEAPVRNLFGAQDAEGATQQALTQAQMQVLQLQQQLQQTTGAYSERLALLERELMSTAEELGRVKAAAGMGSSAPAVDRASYIPRPGQTGVPLTPPSGLRHQEGARPAAMAESERQQLVAMHQIRLDELKAHHVDFVSQLKAQWSAEREGLQQRVKEEEARCSELRKELFDAVRAVAHAPVVPTAATAVPSAAPQPRRGPDVRQFEVSSCLNAPLFSVTS
jgi:hypothetical protein